MRVRTRRRTRSTRARHGSSRDGVVVPRGRHRPPRRLGPRPRGNGSGKAAGNRAGRRADFRGCRILGAAKTGFVGRRERSRVRGHDHPDHLGRDVERRQRRAEDGRRHAVARARARPRPRRGRRAGGVVPAQPRQPQARGCVGGDTRRAARRRRRGGKRARRGEARRGGGLDGLRLRLGGGADLRRGTRRVGRRWNRCALG